ncbi:DUF1272 domain-containing protein [Sulfitobacter sp. S190]|uniref:DUF1272 domain-containing protein n=1 Tax=Sulfitobacter sp. S190 TaxID=2867022 RepID=UPI0021A6C09D|nr:DUF1272 domain-containing protein [Sulfitobacter sp. S190]UWR21549.1 DUF1272 domain-containing protein [Sulfitobacter sp. S190]
MLHLRPSCELCDRALPPDSTQARICSYECTFCADCVQTRLHDVCPNCGGNFAPRPIRPRTAWRDGTGLRHHPATTKAARCTWTDAEITRFVARLRDTAPQDR